MRKTCLSDHEVEAEIARLRNSPHVALARREEEYRLRRRMLLHELRELERKGRELAAVGELLREHFGEEASP